MTDGDQVRRRYARPYAKTARVRRQILEAALEVFAEGGYRATTMKEIAARAQISERGLVHLVQVYASHPDSTVQRPERELTAFRSVALESGEGKEVTLTIRRADLAHWDIRLDRWCVEGGDLTIGVGGSSRDIRQTCRVAVNGDEIRPPLTRSTPMGEVLSHPVAGPIIRQAMVGFAERTEVSALFADEAGAQKMMAAIPIGRLRRMSGRGLTEAQLDQLLAAANAPEPR